MIHRSHGGNIWQYLRSRRRPLLDFSVSINPLGIPERAREKVLENIDKIVHYPEPDSAYLKETLAEFHGLSSRNFLVGNGSIELIHLIPRALKARRVLIPTPTFSEYEFAAKANNSKPLFMESGERDDFMIDTAELMRLMPKSDMAFVCSPNNPTGRALASRNLSSLAKACEEVRRMLVVDETFADFAPQSSEVSLISKSAKNRYLLVLRSLTKTFALPGIRIGYVVGHRDTIDRLARHLYPWNVNTLAQIMAMEVMRDKDYISRTVRILRKEKRYLFDRLNKIEGVKVYPSDANFFLCRLMPSIRMDAGMLSEKLIRRGILIRNCNNFRGLDSRFFRVAVKRRDENRRLVSALKMVLR